jgi:phosphatidate cytidylyltransferase
MLKQRVITAIVMLAILLPAIFYPAHIVFELITMILIAAGAWEWAKLNNISSSGAILTGLIFSCICIASWYFGVVDAKLVWLWVIAGSTWVVLGVWLLRGGVSVWGNVPSVLRLMGGVVALWVAWLAVVQARVIGINFLFSVLVLVWVADVFAYFAGRKLGGRFFTRKLAPSISPGKTWEGACGGLLGVLLCAFIWKAIDELTNQTTASLYTQLARSGVAFMMLSVVFLSAMSVVGDLVESLFKRSAGVKDSSALLPGHGGVLDRIDALLPALPLAMMLVSL